MDNFDIRIEDVRKALKRQRLAEEEHRRVTRALILGYAAELLANQKEPKKVIKTVYTFSLVSAWHLQMGYHFTSEETYKIQKASWTIYKKQKQRDTRSCINCRYSYIDDLYNELNCSNEHHRKEKSGLAENDPLSPETSKPCCKYYSD